MQNVFKQFGAKATGSFRERFHWSIVKLTVLYSLTVIGILLISGVISYTAFSTRIGHRFQPIIIDPDAQIIIPIPSPRFPTQEQVRHDLVISFLMVNVSLVLLAIALSYWLAKKTLEPIKASYEAQERFLGDVSHELRTPLAILQLDLETDPSETSASRLEEVQRMTKLVGDILELSRIEQRTHEKESVALDHVIQSILSRLAPLAHAREVTVSFAPQEHMLATNEELLVHVLTNLVQNAIAYNKIGGTVEVVTKKVGKTMHIIVRDTGVGIASEELGHIFRRFYRADQSRTRTTGGSGLGLAIVQSAVEQLGGTISAKSVVDQGTEIELTFPV